MSSFKKNVTFAPNTIFIEPSGNAVVPRMNPPWPADFKSTLWYSQRELAYIEYTEYRDACSAMRAAATTTTTTTTTTDVHNPLLTAASRGGSGGSARTLVFK
jgi:uncharacterized protein YgiB involved in biofilm formation